MFSPNQSCPHCEGAIQTSELHTEQLSDGCFDAYSHCVFCQVCIYARWEPTGGAPRQDFRIDYNFLTEPRSYAKVCAEMRSLQLNHRKRACVKTERRLRRREVVAAA